MDLTILYFSLGCLFHQLGIPDKKLWAYHMAAEALPPPGCESPADPKAKALAHFQARESANQVGDKAKAEWHTKKLATLVPGIDLNDPFELFEFTGGI